MIQADPIDLSSPDLFLNRDLSQLQFVARVLDQARDEEVPLLERLRFVTICSQVLDEFFEIRVARLRQKVALGLSEPGPDGLALHELVPRIRERVAALVAEQYRLLDEVLLPRLDTEGVRLFRRRSWTAEVDVWAKHFFKSTVRPVITPVGLDPAHPFPRVQNKSLNLIVSLEGTDAFGRSSGLAVVRVPRALPRVVPLPREVSGGEADFALLSSIIHSNVGRLFPGMRARSCHSFRVTRNSELWVDEEEIDDLRRALEGELPRRHYGSAVRLEVDSECGEETVELLTRQFGLEAGDVYRVQGPVNLHRLGAIVEAVDRPELRYRGFVPGLPKELSQGEGLFSVLRRQDVLLHHPYQGFHPVLDLVRRAAADPDVLAVKQTLYRTGADSPVAEALVDAALAGKEVTAVVELRARFDEANNIDLATRLQEAGANVVYGVVGYKTHAKMVLVVRREAEGIRRYVHLGTGNYHVGTARAYTDLGLLTADPDLGEDVHKLFQQLTGLGRATRLRKLWQAPFTLHERLVESIENEAAEARAGRPARIRACLNSLSEPTLIRALYSASMAGVRVELLVRGICCLRPGVPGVSDNISVRSGVGRFLQHVRLWNFHAGGRDLTYASSADWMNRNCFRRIETAFPLEDPAVRERALRECIDAWFDPEVRVWELGPDGDYERVGLADEGPGTAQEVLLNVLAGRGRSGAPDELRLRRDASKKGRARGRG